MLELLKDDLEDNQAGLPADFKQIPTSILEYMVSEAGEDRGDQIKFIKEIMEAVEQIAQSNNHSKASLDKGGGQQQEASKTQGMLPGAQEASPTEEATIEPAMCVFLASGYGWGTVMHEMPISSSPILMTSLPYPRTQ